MKIARWSELSEAERLGLTRRRAAIPAEVVATCGRVIEGVRERGDPAVRAFEREFGGADLDGLDLRVSAEELAGAGASLTEELRRSFDHAIERVERFHRRQLPPRLWLEAFPGGMRAGEQTVAIESVGCYVPRGKGSFGSVLVMLGVPARVAGVERVAVASPPDASGRLDPATLYVAHRLGLDTVYRMGGAQAIAALALGTATVEPVAKLLGPGNPYVTCAKQLLAGEVDIGLQSGPSESIVYADGSVDPAIVALDLCNEAEHGPDSISYLVTTSPAVAAAVATAARELTERLPEPRRGWVAGVLEDRGGALVVDSEDQALAVINRLAAEHLVLDVARPYDVLPAVRYAGEVIIGPHTPVSACNYLAGPNAVLPTAGFARSMSALGVRDFLRTASVVELSADGLEAVRADVERLARSEGFAAHAESVAARPPAAASATGGLGLEWIQLGPTAAVVGRRTKESHVVVGLHLCDRDPGLRDRIQTPRVFLNHMLETIAWRAGLNLQASAVLEGFPLDHVLAEDVGLTLGAAFRGLLREHLAQGAEGGGASVAIIDEAHAAVAVSFEDLTRLAIDGTLDTLPERVEDMACVDMENFYGGFAEGARATVHIHLRGGRDPHHAWEAITRAFGESLRRSLEPNRFRAGTTPGVKGI
ncbi:MAG TPA: histidinol dehydrogenase [Candidatus Micrarchaeia archaeon]|nr:histidinol dehydrogenase [Candidatus Micrarchaeia archaeon]